MKSIFSGNKSFYVLLGIIFCSSALAFILTYYPEREIDFLRHITFGHNILSEKTFSKVISNAQFFPLLNLWTGNLVDNFKVTYVFLNRFAFLMYLISILIFYRIIGFYRNPEDQDSMPLIALAVLACNPVVIVSASTYGDYIYSLCLVLLSWFLVLEKYPEIGALVLAIASGFRITNALWFFPLLILILQDKKYKSALSFSIISIVCGYLVWLGVLVGHGTLNPLILLTEARALAGMNISILEGLKNALSRGIHFVGIPVILFCLVLFKQIDFTRWAERIKNRWELFVAFVVIFLAFVKLGEQQGYIISLVPIIALMLPPFKKTIYSIILCVIIFSMNFVTINFVDNYPSKVYISHGYWVESMTCYPKVNGFLKKFRFNYPHKGDYRPVGCSF